jgi:radical SAM protein with 4Fe4S-binding SPASM domain
MDSCIAIDPQLDFYVKALHVVAKRDKIPLVGTFELTPRCNFDCKMCYVHLKENQIGKHGKELSKDEWLRIAREAKELGMLYLILTGGEIFTRPDFKDLYEELSKMGFLITLLTNGSMINESVMEWLTKCPPYRIRITVYGSNNQIYKDVCGIQNGFAKVDHAIDLIKKARIPLELTSTIIKQNYKDLPKICEYAASKKVYFKYTLGVMKTLRGTETEPDSVRLAPSYFFGKQARQLKITEPVKPGPYPHHNKYCDDCGSYGYTFTITWNGGMTECLFLANQSFDICGKPLKEAWLKLLQEFMEIKKPSECNDCKLEEYCMRCPGALMTESGSPENTTEEYCLNAKCFYISYNNL